MLRPRRQGAKQPDRTENPDTRPHTHSHCLIGRTCPSLEFLFDEPRCVQASKEEDLLTGVSVCFPTFRILLGPLRLCVGTLAIASQRGPRPQPKTSTQSSLRLHRGTEKKAEKEWDPSSSSSPWPRWALRELCVGSCSWWLVESEAHILRGPQRICEIVVHLGGGAPGIQHIMSLFQSRFIADCRG